MSIVVKFPRGKGLTLGIDLLDDCLHLRYKYAILRVIRSIGMVNMENTGAGESGGCDSSVSFGCMDCPHVLEELKRLKAAQEALSELAMRYSPHLPPAEAFPTGVYLWLAGQSATDMHKLREGCPGPEDIIATDTKGGANYHIRRCRSPQNPEGSGMTCEELPVEHQSAVDGNEMK